MVLEEFFHDRQVVVGSDLFLAGGIAVFVDDFAVLDDQPVGEAVAVHVFVVGEVVEGDHQWFLAFGQFQRFQFDAAVGAGGVELVRADQDVVAVVDLLDDFFEFVDGDHVVEVALGLVVAVEGSFRVRDQGVEEQVRDHGVIGPGSEILLRRRNSEILNG